MTPEDVRAAAERLTQFHQRFAPLFGKDGAQDNASIYVKGLMTCPERKGVDPDRSAMAGRSSRAVSGYGASSRHFARDAGARDRTWSGDPRSTGRAPPGP